MDNQEGSKKKLYKRWWFWAGVIVLCLIVGLANENNAPARSTAAPDESGTAQTPAAPGQSASVPAPAAKKSVPAPTESQPVPTPKSASVPASAPASMQTLLDISGSGSKTTQSFTAAGQWNLIWSYDCSKFGNQGNFQVFIYNGDGSMSFSNSGVNQLGASGSDTDYYHVGGTFYLTVNSECSWHIQVKG